jgi:RimJ/RimL family protein N-acetyltransferase
MLLQQPGLCMKRQKQAIIFRPTSAEDIDVLYDLLNDLPAQGKRFFHPHPFDKATIAQICLPQKDRYFVMIVGTTMVGYSMLRFFGYETPSLGCCIRRGYERKGYGTKLAQWTINKAKELGCQQVILKVYKANEAAVRLYQDVGFTITGEIPETKELTMTITF